jgi:hypothetical protein
MFKHKSDNYSSYMYKILWGVCMAGFANLSADFSIAEEKEVQKGFAELADAPGAVTFSPPEGWVVADPKQLPSNILVFVVGKSIHEYPPSLNLAYDKFSGTLKQYLQKIVKPSNQRQGAEWKDLGTIRTAAGEASLSQVDTKTKWGLERQMQVIFVRNGITYILTAAALKEDFPKFYNDFFKSFRSIKINDALQD